MSEALIPSLGLLVYQSLGVGVIGLDSDCRIILWNDWMENHSSIKRSHILGKDIFGQFPSIKDKKQDKYILRSLEKRIPCLLTPLLHEAFIPLEIRKGHEKIPMRQNVKILPVTGTENETEVMIVIEDFTEQMLHEAEIQRLTRILKGVRNVSQLITQVDSEDELLTGACKILVDDIGYTFSWVGFIEEGSFDIKPRAFAGIEREAIDGLVVKWDESEYGNGVTGKAIKTGKVQVVQEIQEDPMSRPWHEFATGTGYQSTCSLPLMVDDRVIGALNVHSPSKGVFLGEELDLLEEVTDDIAYAISAIRERKRRRQAEEALRESEEKYRGLYENAPNPYFSVSSVDGSIIRCNIKAAQLLGYEKEEITRLKVFDLYVDSSHGLSKAKEIFRPFGAGESIKDVQLQMRHKNGDPIWISLSVEPVSDANGAVIESRSVVIDISERKRAEKALRLSNEELLEEYGQRKMLSKRLIELLEKDRQQIAMELHDHIGQILTSLKMNLEIIHGKLDPGHTELVAQITAAKERTIQAIKDIKDVSHGLRPAMLDALGLVSSLRELFNEIQQQTDMEFHFFSKNIPKRFDPEKELAIYRIAQEALSNIIRHSQAKNVFLNIVKKDKKLSLSIEDSGVGFDQNKVMKPSKKKGPLGLLIMRERAVQLGGEFTVESQHGKGTHLLVEIPL